MTHYKRIIQNGAIVGTNNLLLLNCIQGASAFRLGRLLCCYENVYWYKHNDNGQYPWTFHNPKTDDESLLLESEFSQYHFDRLLRNDQDDRRVFVPMVGSKIERYWGNTNWIYRWVDIMSKLDFPEPDKYLIIIVHDSPQYLRKIFPDSFIFNLISNPDVATQRHLKTSANYRINYQFEGQRPDYKTEWVERIESLLTINPDATDKELWMYNNKSTEEEYETHMYKIQRQLNDKNLSESKFANITTTWDEFDPYKLETTFGKINDNFNKLL